MDNLEDQEEENSYRKKTVDLGDLYNNINVQLKHRQGKNQMYEAHSRGWERMVEKATDRLEDQMDEQEDKEEEDSYRKKTIDIGELYNNINLQLKNKQVHTDDFDARVEAYEQAMAQDQKIDDDNEKKMQEDSKARSIMA